MHITLDAITKRFGAFTALDGVSLEIHSGELAALLGPSGSGKTSLLRVIAGLDMPDEGRLCFDGRDATYRGLRDRSVGFVFQHYALFRHMTVFENVAFGLRVRPRRERLSERAIRERVMRLLELVQLGVLADRLPAQLSGGQRQRVALARALAVEPQLLLLDEPFGSLDAKVRKELRRWLRRLHDELHVTTVFVTHDQEEALELADRVIIMNQGRIEQIGTPNEVYEQPATSFVYQFLGDVNLFRGRVDGAALRIAGLDVDIPVRTAPQGDAHVYIRPHALTISDHPTGAVEFRARVERVTEAGPLVRIALVSAWGEPIRVEMSQERYRTLRLGQNEDVFVGLDGQDVFVAPSPDSHGHASAGGLRVAGQADVVE